MSGSTKPELKECNGDFLIKKDFVTIVVGQPICACYESELY